ncbi:MAG: hydrogenase subunit MbhD domain-containing protein [Candidatus Omnitrophota bacterium]|jgi:multisubunit Na+/H+ antiporter MnhB subunit
MELHLILIFMIFAAAVAVEAHDLVSSLIGLSAVGLSLSLAFLILKAPSLAITQLVVEILCIIILIRGTINKDLPFVWDGRWLFNTASTLLFIVCFLLFAFFALKELPVFGAPLMRVSEKYLSDGFAQTGSLNLVSAITLYFRNYDALGETAVLFAAIVGVLAITRKEGRSHGK